MLQLMNEALAIEIVLLIQKHNHYECDIVHLYNASKLYIYVKIAIEFNEYYFR